MFPSESSIFYSDSSGISLFEAKDACNNNIFLVFLCNRKNKIQVFDKFFLLHLQLVANKKEYLNIQFYNHDVNFYEIVE